jgi:histidine triad (HIT) family protein
MIIDGELPARFVWRDDLCVAFLSINPLADGHVLVVPREEVDHWTDADPELLAHLTRVAQVIGQALHGEFGRARVALTIVGLEVPHLHIHVVPIDRMSDVDFANADPAPDPAHLDDVAERIRGSLRRMGRREVA